MGRRIDNPVISGDSKSNAVDPLAGLRESLEPWLRTILREELAQKESLPKLLYSTKEAAQILGVPETWLASAARTGAIASVRVGHYVRFAKPDLDDFIAKNRIDVDNEPAIGIRYGYHDSEGIATRKTPVEVDAKTTRRSA
jgi:excisionase family DNA binding protein